VTAVDMLAAAVTAAMESAGLPERQPAFERPRNREHGDWSTNVAMTLAKPLGRPPREVAAAIIEALEAPPSVEAVEIAGPGFINFRLAQDAFADVVRQAVTEGDAYGRSDAGRGRGIDVEFVSANPTGPLHVGHGRQAVLGDAIAALLDATGWAVTREYYFNDAGVQMTKFGESVAAALAGEPPPEDGYHGAYVGELAAELAAAGETDDVAEAAYQRMLSRITATLDRLGVRFDVFFGERSLHESGALRRTVERLRAAGHAYEADGAVWLRTTAFGDDKDRVLIKADGQPTYFAADCAYISDKAGRGYDLLMYVFGSDHHGYIDRMLAVADAEGVGRDRVEIVIHQFVNLVRDGKPVEMSKRSGEIVTFDELLDEVGADAARYTLLRFSPDVPIDFDIAEVVRQERDNPVFYVQYSSARIAGIMRTATERGVDPGDVADAPLELLRHDSERELIRRVGRFPEVVTEAAEDRAPHKVARYAEGLAEAFHKFYTDCQVVSDDPALTRARYWLVVAARQTLGNALRLLGVSAPERM
jgi:arginyl-tRNA synthetase